MKRFAATAVRATLFALALALPSAHALGDALTDRAAALLNRGDAKSAYELLLPLEPQRAGDPQYDYLLGVAALDAGDPERAVFALERVLALQPDNALARAEIARAYYVMGEREAARREFEAVRRYDIPEDAKATVDRFLSAIAAAEGTRIDGFIELGAGYDSNVSSALATSTIAIPAFGGAAFTLDPSLTERGDQFFNVAGGVAFTRKLSQPWSLVGGIAAYLRRNTDATRFDTTSVDGNIGVRYMRGLDAFTLGAQGQYYAVDAARYREATGAVAQWQHAFDERTQASVFGQYVQLRYESQPVRDADRSILGVAFARAFSGALSPAVYGSIYGGQEKALDPAYPHLGHTPVGVRAGGQLRLGGGWSAFASASYEQRKYDGPEPLFFTTREDRQTDVIAGLAYLLRPGTTLLAQLAYTDNNSNIPLNDFDRTISSVALRFNF
jgi:tetratricopeptide (TPR) repeat protein